MKITKLNNSVDIFKYLLGSIYIGSGRSGMCFLRPDGNIIKVFYSFERKKMIYFKNFDILSNDTYKSPKKFFVLGDKCAAYICPYVQAKTFKFMKYFTSLDKILKNYDRLYKDTKDISKKNFSVEDVNEKNILFSSIFYIIDLDEGYFNKKNDIQDIFSYNMMKINEAIITSLFNVKQDYILDFYDDKIKELYHKSTHEDYSKFPELIEEFQKRCEPDKYSVYTLRHKVSYINKHNSYFRYN